VDNEKIGRFKSCFFGIGKLQKIILIGLLSLLALSQIACGQSAAQKEKKRVESNKKSELKGKIGNIIKITPII